MSKTLVNGTSYDIKGGKCLVNGTGYSITKGKTLIDGTSHDINFIKKLYLFNYGDQCTDITGGWTTDANVNGNNGYRYISNEVMYVKGSPGRNMCEFGYRTVNRINLNGYTRLCMTVTAASLSQYASEHPDLAPYKCGFSAVGAYNAGTLTPPECWNVVWNPGDFGYHSVNLGTYSNLTAYISVFGCAGSGSITVSQIWLE